LIKQNVLTPSSLARRVKIVCTLGPATQSKESITKLIGEGMDIARLNFSHGTHEFHASLIKIIRECSKSTGKNVAILQDLQGPKLRAGKLKEGKVTLKVKEHYLLYPEGAEPSTRFKFDKSIPISAEIAHEIVKDLKKGARILFDDGKISTFVLDIVGDEVLVEADVGGVLTSNKGMNLPGTPLSLSCCTDKDLEDLKFGLEQKVDAVALSFVRTAQDIEFVRKIILEHSSHDPLLFAKIEREEAVEAPESIIQVSDGILIARGDMAVELGPDRVPVVQKELIQACNALGVPVITATQMLESMIFAPTPTRAEANDVANAVFDGTDAVMLSAETASGQYPHETVRVMSKIILEAERYTDRFSVHAAIQPLAGSVVDSVQYSAAKIAQHVGAVALACVTHSGTAAKTLSKYRPPTPIIAIMDQEHSLRKLSFFWGVQGVLIPKIVATDDFFQMIEAILKSHRLVENQDYVVITAGIPTLGRGTTNTVKVHKIGAPIERAGPSQLS